MNQPVTTSKEFQVEGLSNLQLGTPAGDIQLIGHDENLIKVEVMVSVRRWSTLFLTEEFLADFELDDEIINLKFKQTGPNLVILGRPIFFNVYNWFNYHKISFRVFLPKTINTNFKSGGNIFLNNVEGIHQFTTWGGNILIKDSKGTLKGTTMGGKVEIDNCDAKIDVKTMGGNISLIENKGEINLKTMGGNINVSNNKGNIYVKTAGGNITGSGNWGDLKCITAGGNIRFFDAEGNIGATTMGGNVSVEMRSVKDYLWLDTRGGNINVSLNLNQGLNLDLSGRRLIVPTLQNFEGYHTRNQINGKINGDGPSVKIKTSGGRIRLNDTGFRSKPTNFQENQAEFQEKKTAFQAKPQQSPTNTSKSFEDFLPKQEVKYPKSFTKSDTQITTSDYISNRFFDFLFALFFCLLLTYGLSSIVYFSLEIINPQNLSSIISKGVILSNIAYGIASLLSVYIFIFSLENKIRKTLPKYLTIIALTFFIGSAFQALVGIFYWSTVDMASIQREENSVSKVYFLLPLIVSSVYYYSWRRTSQITRKISEQEYQLLNLEKLKTRADLSALQARINPHFLYNSLNSIASLVHSDPDKAEEMTILLSKLFRYTTDRNNEHFSSIADELEIVKTYLSIEQVRFGDRLKFSTELDKNLEDFQIPRLLLQPIVENAIKHGISKISGEGKIEVKIFEKDGNVILSVHDSGVPFPEEMASGYGLRSIQDKLRLIYKDDAVLEIQNDETYKAVIITIKKK